MSKFDEILNSSDASDALLGEQIDKMARRDFDLSSAITSFTESNQVFSGVEVAYAKAIRANGLVCLSIRLKGTVTSFAKSNNYGKIIALGKVDASLIPLVNTMGVVYQNGNTNRYTANIDESGNLFINSPFGYNLNTLTDNSNVSISIAYATK